MYQNGAETARFAFVWGGSETPSALLLYRIINTEFYVDEGQCGDGGSRMTDEIFELGSSIERLIETIEELMQILQDLKE